MEIQAYLSTNKVDRAIPLRVHRLIRVAPVFLIWIYAQTRVHSPDVGNSSPRAASKMALMARGRMAGEPLVVVACSIDPSAGAFKRAADAVALAL
jgi:hypothetical protein